jgi:NADH:ubiquinone oxidoreductase subunit F (NADH-binding)
MLPKKAQREKVLEVLDEVGGLAPGRVDEVARRTGVPAADVYGVATFYHLLSDPTTDVLVCKGLSCKIAGCDELAASLAEAGETTAMVSCLGRCDLAPAARHRRRDQPVPPPAFSPSSPEHAIDLAAPQTERYEGLRQALARGADWVCGELETSGIQGRGGAGFPAHVKWQGVRRQPERERYVVLNADEGEPATFKDREVMLRRPHLVIEGLAVAAFALEADDVYVYVRGEFGAARSALERALAEARNRGEIGDDTPRWHFVDGHGAYICGEETALLEALEGKRGMPRMKPPFPVEVGFRGKPTLIQNVETIACVPAILVRGGDWFRAAGRTGPGSKLYCMSGHVARPGVFEAPLGVRFDELLEMAGGVAGTGTLKAFSPGGASSGFLPASMAGVAMDFKALAQAGSMLGSAGCVALDTSVDMAEAALSQAVFFEEESCGQCAPCRIGTQMLRQALDRYLASDRDPATLAEVREVAWGMTEASICGLGQAASLPLTTAMTHFPAELGVDTV